MLSKISSFLCFSFIILGAEANLAPFITPCNWKDSDCILKSSKIALPHLAEGTTKLGLPAADPLKLDKVVADSGDLKLSFYDAIVKGIAKCNIIKSTRNEADGKSTGVLAAECPVTVTGSYKMSGKLLFINAEGDGPFEIKTEKIRITIDWSAKTFNGKDGKKHYKISSFEYKYEPLERIYIDLQNLFNGDKAQGEPVLKVLNDSWDVIVADLGKPLFNEILKKTVHIVDLLFRTVPNDELEIA